MSKLLHIVDILLLLRVFYELVVHSKEGSTPEDFRIILALCSPRVAL